MRLNLFLLIAFGLLNASCQRQNESADHKHDSTASPEVQADTIKKSIPKEEHAMIGGTHFAIKYHAPAVRGRTIWGGLVPYDEVWVTGAHSATSIEFDKDISINDRKITAGKYAVFTIPGQDKWIIILNKNWEQHLADEYDPKDDVVRVEVIPETLANLQERLKYSVASDGGSGVLVSIRWEKVSVSLPITLD